MDERTPRTAAATAARKALGNERRAERLRADGWTVIPPNTVEPTALVYCAVVRPGRDPGWIRLTVLGSADAGATGGHRANLDGRGDRVVEQCNVPGQLPATAQLVSRFDALARDLVAAGWRPVGGWTLGTDRDGVHAVVPVVRDTPGVGHGAANRA